MATAQIWVDIDAEGRVYPAGSDTPVPEASIDYLRYDRSTLAEGDIVVQADGRCYRICPYYDAEFGDFKTMMARDVAEPHLFKPVGVLEDPLIRIYHCGEPRHDWIA